MFSAKQGHYWYHFYYVFWYDAVTITWTHFYKRSL